MNAATVNRGMAATPAIVAWVRCDGVLRRRCVTGVPRTTVGDRRLRTGDGRGDLCLRGVGGGGDTRGYRFREDDVFDDMDGALVVFGVFGVGVLEFVDGGALRSFGVFLF